MSDNRHLIWSNYDLDYEDWKDELEAEYPEKTEYERMELMKSTATIWTMKGAI